MIRIIIFLANLEGKVRDTKAKTEKRVVEQEYAKLKKEIAPYKKNAPESPSLGDRVKATFTNVKNIARNAVDNTLGYGVAKYQNYKTKKHFKKNPESKDKVVYLMHGVMQNEGSQWRLAKQLKQKGYKPYHLKGHHSLPTRKESTEKAFEQIKDFHNYTKLKNPHKRKDRYSGHSSGADIGIYMSGDKRLTDYGIKPPVQARAPAPYGAEGKTIGQKLLMPLASKDNVKTLKGKKHAVEMSRVKSGGVDVIAGEYDDLVTPADAVYKGAKHYLIKGKDSTHFGTSGGNKEINEVLIDMLERKPGQKYKGKYKMAA